MPDVHTKDISLPELAERMRDIDIAMLSTHTENGQIASRPMSNNRDVDYDGDSFYFTFDQSRTVSDIRNNPKVTLAFQSDDTFYATVEGEAKLFTDKPTIQQHWQESLNEWFPDGPETEGVVMIQVNARRIKYWDGLAAGEVKL